MATREIIDFIINLGGNVAQGANAAANALDRLGQSAKKTAQTIATDLGKAARSQNQNQLLAQFESLSSLLIQCGGAASQLGIAMSTAARPTYLFASQAGAAGVALLAIPAAAAAAVLGINALARAGESAIETLQKMGRLDLIEAEQLQELKDYRSAVDDFTASLAALKAQAGAAAAPTAARNVSAASLLLQGDQEAWGAVLEGLTTPFGGGLGPALRLQELANSRTAEVVAEEQARRDFLRETETTMRQMEDEEKIRKDQKTAAPAAIAKRIADEEAAANKRIAASKREQAAMEEAWGLYRSMLTDIRSISAEFDKAAKDNPAAVFQRAAIEKAAKENEYKRTLEAMAGFKDLEKAHKEAVEDALGKIDDADFIMNRVRYDKNGNIIAERAIRDPAYDARMLGTAATVAGGADVGSIVASAGGGPVGMILGLLANGGAYDAIQGLFDQVMEIYTDLPKEIGRIVGDLVPEMVRQAPEMASAFLVLAPAIVTELIDAAPELFGSLLEATLNAPYIVADAILALPSEIAKALEAWGKDAINPFDGSGSVEARERRAAFIGAAIGTVVGGPGLGTAAGATVGLGIDRLGSGRGLGGGKASRSRQSGGVYIGQVVAPNPREHVRQLRQIQGSYGYGYDLDPVVA